MKVSRTAVNATLAVMFAIIFRYCYTGFLNYWFEYAGFPLYRREISFLALSFVFAVSPVLFYRGVRALSSVVVTFIYVLLYVPIILTFAFGSNRPIAEIVLTQLTFFGSMVVLVLADGIIIENPLDISLDVDLMPLVLCGTAVLTLAVAAVYRGSLMFAGFSAIYEQRAATSDLGNDLVSRYLFSWLRTVLIPICLAHGLVARRLRYFVVGAVGCVIFYMATATKIMIILPFLYAGLYLTFRAGRLRYFFPAVLGGLATLLLILLLLPRDETNSTFLISSVLMQRAVGNGGQITMAYADFFSTHPQTNYSHLNIVNALTGSYPYGSLGLGEVVGQFYWSDDMNANANFWATDGFAALGLAGVPFATIVCAALLVGINMVTQSHDRLFVTLCFVPFISTMLNTSLFSSLWSGGGALLVLFLMINRHPSRGSRPRAIVAA